MANKVYSSLGVQINGDNISTTISFDILKAPINAPWGSKHPTELIAAHNDSIGPAVTSFDLSGTIVSLTFASAFTNGVFVTLEFLF